MARLRLAGRRYGRLVPFFAVVAGPIAALNFRARYGTTTRSWRLSWAPGFLVMLTGFVLMALTWPGWLQGFNRRERAAGLGRIR